MQFTKQADVFGDFAAVGFESAVEVVELDSTCRAGSALNSFEGSVLSGVVPNTFPTGDHIKAVVQFFDKGRHLLGVILQVSVHAENDRATGHFKTGLQGIGLPVTPEYRPRTAESCWAQSCSWPLNNHCCRRPQKHLITLIVRFHHCFDLLEQLGQGGFLVENWNDAADVYFSL